MLGVLFAPCLAALRFPGFHFWSVGLVSVRLEVGGWWVLETYIGGCGNVSMRVQGSFVVGFTKMAFFDGFVDLESGWRLVGRLGLNLKVEWVAEIVCVQSK